MIKVTASKRQVAVTSAVAAPSEAEVVGRQGGGGEKVRKKLSIYIKYMIEETYVSVLHHVLYCIDTEFDVP